jgi:hypothetical protein
MLSSSGDFGLIGPRGIIKKKLDRSGTNRNRNFLPKDQKINQ